MTQGTEPLVETQWIDLTTRGARRKTFRNLLIASIGFSIAAGVARSLGGLPESVLMALDFEAEMIPPWRMTVVGLMALAIFLVMVWGIYDLWRYRRSGVPKFFGPMLLPVFLLLPGPNVTPPLSGYLYLLSSIACGMLLFMCLTQPDVFEPATADSVRPPATPPVAANETKAT